ncbi:hypothetical protein LPC08_21005 [Roseomonas sp. OT10]|uniref:hypothetical protein n=1 Tax=Roseomonas cutis TaxID=2897332 RepID=UPI001E40F139|nr:hypothetical protein [Roseomonas sp. OT10]UFN48467.1 hypothetical protein LPC08_21005 [Roseomonas sp. OT10]
MSMTMAPLPLTLACADYGRVLPLATGAVTPEGIDLTLALGRSGSWPMRAALMRQVLADPALAGGEGSMAQHLRRVAAGDRSFVALPVFVLRGFAAHDLYVRKDGPVRRPDELIGRRVGLYSWVASGSVWYRHFQAGLGVPLDAVEWWVGDIEGVGETPPAPDLPPGVRAAPPGRFLAEMLAKGEIDALWSPPRPTLYHADNGPLTRLFPDFRPVETEYYRHTGIFPPMHVILLRRDAWEAAPWIARSLTDAFQQASREFDASQRGFPDAFPWMEAEFEPVTKLLGPEPYAHGLSEANRNAMQVFIDQALAIGLIQRPVAVEEYFEEFLRS